MQILPQTFFTFLLIVLWRVFTHGLLFHVRVYFHLPSISNFLNILFDILLFSSKYSDLELAERIRKRDSSTNSYPLYLLSKRSDPTSNGWQIWIFSVRIFCLRMTFSMISRKRIPLAWLFNFPRGKMVEIKKA